ncbi:hypothetical protein C1645_740863 [Glomus cerebriforme]|uniref:RING-type domain-containing protein n=1 Tax=Glomus cerebriforme TaxID=658196 RepID=A0A397SNF2_9GLOM|nr:hypothetical protein C1645_740863 [Glomus cerebriforme]
MSSSESTKAPESFQVPERSRPSLANHRNLAYNILKYLEDDIVGDKEILELEPCSECTNNILALPLKALTILSCGHIFHRSCIEKQLLFIKPGACPFPDCGKIVEIVVNPNSTRRDSQSSQSSGTSALTNLMGEKFNLIPTTIPEDPMEDVEDTSNQETEKRAICAKCAEEISVDVPKDTVFLSCKHIVHYDCIDNPRKKCPTCPGEVLESIPEEEASSTAQRKRTSDLSESTRQSSSKKQKTSTNDGESPTLKRLIKELKTPSSASTDTQPPSLTPGTLLNCMRQSSRLKTKIEIQIE